MNKKSSNIVPSGPPDSAFESHMSNLTERSKNTLSPKQMTEALVDFQTGNIRRPQLDISGDFQQFLLTVQENPQFGRNTPVIVLSPLASAMMRRLAEQSNSLKKELAFSFRGVTIRGANHDMLVGAYLSPATDLAKTQTASVFLDNTLEKERATQIAEQIKLAEPLKQRTNSPRGDVLVSGHIHHSSLHQNSWGVPSSHDKDQIEAYLKDPKQKIKNFFWLVLTKKPDGSISYTATWSHKNSQGEIVHTKIPIIEPFGELGLRMPFKVLE